MKISTKNSNNFSSINPNFRAIIVSKEKNLSKIIKSLSNKELIEFKNILQEQQHNPVIAFIDINKYKQLTAKLYCSYYLKNFKEKYSQKFLIESNFDFIKRIAKACNEYRKQL